MKKAVYFFICLSFLGLLVGTPLLVYSATDNKAEIEALNKKIAEKKIKIEQIEKSIAEYKDKIKETQLAKKSLSNQMSILNNRVTEIELDITATEEKLTSLNLEIEALELGIEDKEKVIDKQKKISAGLIRSLHLEDGKNYVEIASGYSSFSDFYNRIQYLETTGSALNTSIKTLKSIKEDLESKRQQISEKKAIYDNLNDELKEKKRGLSEQLFLKGDLLVKTNQSEKKYNTLLSNLSQQYQAIEGEITSYEREVRLQLEKQKALDDLENSSATFSWPTISHYVTSPFHDPDYPYRNVFEHNGMDIKSTQGSAIKAAAAGYIARAKRCSTASCYSYVMIVHSDGLATVYGHLSAINVSEDQFVAKGDIIGLSGGRPGTVGAGPFVTGPHLHFEVRKNGIPVDPANYLN